MVCLQSYQAVLGVVVFTWVRYGLGFSISNGISDIGVSQEIPARSGQNGDFWSLIMCPQYLIIEHFQPNQST